MNRDIESYRTLLEAQQKHRDAASLGSAIDCSGPTLVRTEFGSVSDINQLIARYGSVPPPSRPVHYGEADMNQDLLSAYEQVGRAELQFSQLPESLRAGYSDWREFAAALMRGEIDLAAGAEPAGAPEASPESPDDVPGGSAPAATSA